MSPAIPLWNVIGKAQHGFVIESVHSIAASTVMLPLLKFTGTDGRIWRFYCDSDIEQNFLFHLHNAGAIQWFFSALITQQNVDTRIQEKPIHAGDPAR